MSIIEGKWNIYQGKFPSSCHFDGFEIVSYHLELNCCYLFIYYFLHMGPP